MLSGLPGISFGALGGTRASLLRMLSFSNAIIINVGRRMVEARVDILLDRLDGVRSNGVGKWVCRCPAHEDRNPSLSIRMGNDGVILMHCFAGCSTADVAKAIDLDLSDLFPPRQPDVHQAKPKAFALAPIVAAFEGDLIVCQLLLAEIGAGKLISPVDQEFARGAARRLLDAIQQGGRCV